MIWCGSVMEKHCAAPFDSLLGKYSIHSSIRDTEHMHFTRMTSDVLGTSEI